MNQSSIQYMCLLEKSGVFYSEMEELYKDGDIDFSKSDTEREPKVYNASFSPEDGREICVEFVLSNDTAWINRIGVGELATFECD